jgi:ketosteroid isomerase-like protein
MTAANTQTASGTREIVDRFYAAWGSQDLQAVRRLLRDDLSFHGPIDTFSSADAYLASIQRLFAIVRGTELQRVFVDGQDTCTIYDLVTTTSARTVPVAEWITVKDDKISCIRVYFDARPFSPPIGH